MHFFANPSSRTSSTATRSGRTGCAGRYDNMPGCGAGDTKGEGRWIQTGGPAPRFQSAQSVLLIERDALLRERASRVSRWVHQTEELVRDMLERRRAQRRVATHQKLDKPNLALFHARFRTAGRHGDHELERNEAVRVRPDRLRVGGMRGQNGGEVRDEGRSQRNLRVRTGLTVLIETESAWRVRRMCEYL